MHGCDQRERYQTGNHSPEVSLLPGSALSRNNRKLPGCPDIVLKKYKTAVFVDGCFWHGHEDCKYFKLPKSNINFWKHKIAMNKARDYANTIDLELAGWKVLRVWECEIKTKAKREETLQYSYAQITRSSYKASYVIIL